MLTTIRVSESFFKLLQVEADKRGVTPDSLCENWANLGMIIEENLSEDEVKMLLEGQGQLVLTY